MKVRVGRLAKSHGVKLADATEYWSERAAIREYLGEMPRGDAEVAALSDLVEWAGRRK